MDGDRNYWDGWMRRRMSRRSMLQRMGLTGIALAGGSSLWACSQSQTTPKASEPTPKSAEPTKAAATPTPAAPRPKRGGTLRIGVDMGKQMGDPDIHAAWLGGGPYNPPLWEPLLKYNEKFEYMPGLCESWKVLDDVTVEFKLRKGVKFWDGTEWNTKVLKWNLDRWLDPATKSPRNFIVQAMKTIEYPDDYTWKVVLSEPQASFLGDLAEVTMGMMSPNFVNDGKTSAVGTGPFVVTEKAPDSHFLLSRNKDYWGKDQNGDQLPYLDALRFVVIPDDTVRLANLRTGEIDVNFVTPTRDVERIKQEPNLKVTIQPGVSATGLFWNLSRAPFKSLNFRRACAWAVNREAIVKVATFGLGTPFVSAVFPVHGWVFDPNLPVPKYDPVKAKQYLDAAIAEGIKPEFTGYIEAGETMQAAQMVQADLGKLGIKFNIVPEQAGTASQRFWTSWQIDAFASSHRFTPDPYSKLRVASHSAGRYLPEKAELGKDWDTPEKYFARIDPLIEDSNKTFDVKKRKELMEKAAVIIGDEVGFFGWHYRSVVMSMSKKVEGVTWGGDDKGRFDRGWIKS